MPYSIGQVAKKTGLSEYTIRYYDKQGLMPFVHRSDSGRREFNDHDLAFLDLITCLKKTGMPLTEIKEFVDMSVAGDSTLKARLDLFKTQQAVVEEEIKEAQKRLHKLQFKVKYYEKACEVGTESAVFGDCDAEGMPIYVDEEILKQRMIEINAHKAE